MWSRDRVLGLFRGTLIAYFFGASVLTDAYYSAFKISNFFRQLLGEGALGNTFIPLYHKKKKEEGEERSREYIFSVLNITFLFSFVVSVLMIIFSSYIIDFIVVGFNDELKIVASRLLKIMSFYFLFISLSGMMGSILNNFGYFAIPASTSIFFNLSIISSAIWLTKYFDIDALAYGVLIGGILQFLVVFFPFLKLLKTYSLKIDFKDIYLKFLGIKLIPMLVGVFARQVNTIVDQFFASFLVAGSITALENASRIYLLPVGVFGVTISNVLFPSISRAAANGDKKDTNRRIVSALNFLNFLTIPSLFVLTFFSKDVIRLIFSYGKFNEEAVKITSECLFYYSLGLLFYVGVQLISKGYYAMGDNKRPAKFSIIAIIMNIVLNYLLIKNFQHKGLALATSISSGVNFFLLLFIYIKNYVKLDLKNIILTSIKICISSIIATCAAYYINNVILKLIVFSAIFLLQWAYPIFKYRERVFYKKWLVLFWILCYNQLKSYKFQGGRTMGLGDFLFKEKEEKYLKQIENLQNKLKKQEEEISQLKYDLEVVTQERDNRISGKQLEIFERNLKQNVESSKKYKELLISYRINPEKIQYKYKVELRNFYSGKKFQEILNILNEKNILFVDYLKEEDFNDIPKETKNFDEAKQRFLDFKSGKFDWETATFINRGEKVSKIYSKTKKLMTVFSDLYLEFKDDITNFDFICLLSYGFKTPQIEEFIQKRDEYYKEYRI